MGPRDAIASTWYLNTVRIRTWDHFPVVVKFEGREMKFQKRKKAGQAGPPCPTWRRRSSRISACAPKDHAVGLMTRKKMVSWPCNLDWRLQQLKLRLLRQNPGTVKKIRVPEEIRECSTLAAQCRDPVKRKILRKKARKARREFDAKVGALPRGKIVNRPVVTKLWINGRASEDRDEWKEEIKIHCSKCYDDKSETLEVQAERTESRDAEAIVW